MTRTTSSGPDGGTEADRQLVEDLRRAVEGDELFVLYQPYIDLQTNDIAGVEALVRWRHPDRGVLEPAMFLPQVETFWTSSSLSMPGWWARPAARCRPGGPRGSRRPGYRSMWPPSTCSHPDFVTTVDRAFGRPRAGPDRLELEIAERVTPDPGGVMLANVEELRRHGVRFSIDDFSTTGSTFDRVAAFPW